MGDSGGSILGSSALLGGPFVPDLRSMLLLTLLKSAVGGAAGALFFLHVFALFWIHLVFSFFVFTHFFIFDVILLYLMYFSCI